MALGLGLLGLLFAVLLAAAGVWFEWTRRGLLEVRQPQRISSLRRDRQFEMVVSGRVRFQLLTDQMLRIEALDPSMPDDSFEDRPSLIFATRDRFLANLKDDAPGILVGDNGDQLQIATSKINVLYGSKSNPWKTAPPLTSESISVELRDTKTIWRPGMAPTGNLFGTIRTLDHVDGATPLELGLLSKDGWAIVNDTGSPLLDSDEPGDVIPWAHQRNVGEKYEDIYIMAYGRDYRKALADYVAVAGKVPLPPKFAFGSYWSRWMTYSDQDLKDLVLAFREHRLPLDVLVIDMDWHLTAYDLMDMGYVDLAGQPIGWTGYTWNKTLFEDPKSFLDWCDDKGLQTTLNLHPASGIQPFEESYIEMVEAMGLKPGNKVHVPFDVVDTQFATSWFDHVLRKLEKQGVDFFWLDWQQHNHTSITGLNPTIWLNHVFFNDMERRRSTNDRGLILHRWGGLGSHRYQVGFSGDTWITWKSLEFQIYFTATAANVGFGFWSHDIGGFMSKEKSEGELFLRWIQWGALSPMFRTHAWRVAWLERRMWIYGPKFFPLMREAVLLRYSLLPYIYSESRRTHDDGISIVYPLYYDFPDLEESYLYKNQYMFGSSLLVAPIVGPVNKLSGIATRTVFIPPGNWVEWHSSTFLQGPIIHTISASLSEIPIYVRAGSVLPMMVPGANVASSPVDRFLVSIFPGKDGKAGEYSVYEDDGKTKDYKEKNNATGWANTLVQSRPLGDDGWEVIVHPRNGKYDDAPLSRAYSIRLVGVQPPSSVVAGDSKLTGRFEDPADSFQWAVSRKDTEEVWDELEDNKDRTEPTEGWTYEADRLSLVVSSKVMPANEPLVVKITFSTQLSETLPALHTGFVGLVRRAEHTHALLNAQADDILSRLDEVAKAPKRIKESPSTIFVEIAGVRKTVDEIIDLLDKESTSKQRTLALASLRPSA